MTYSSEQKDVLNNLFLVQNVEKVIIDYLCYVMLCLCRFMPDIKPKCAQINPTSLLQTQRFEN